jgi:nucleoside triphosphate pyrophosphatase
MDTLILGSRSPRRKEIMNYFSLPFTQVSSAFAEESVPFKGDPAHYVIEVAKGKAEDLMTKYPKNLILTADTIVFREGKIFGIPKNECQAFETLLSLEGKWHEVYSGITLVGDGKLDHTFEKTKVLLNILTKQEIEQYLAHKIWTDKAGGYAIQRSGGLLVNKIEGCFYNVMGFPINAIQRLLLKHGIDLWNYVKD